jgi:SAM-dependent methyltransferase
MSIETEERRRRTSRAAQRERLYYRLFGADGVLSRVLPAGATVLDVGCSDGRGSAVLTGVAGCDIYRPKLVEAVRSGRRGPVVQTDVRQLPYRDGAYDAVVALDVIEHFEKPDGLLVMAEMERVSRNLAVVMTPAGFLEQPGTREEPWQEHRCGFEPEELAVLGYQVRGVGGLAVLRGDYGAFRAGLPGQLVAAATQPFVRRRPGRAFHLVGVKRVGP